MAAPIYTPTESAQGFPFLDILTDACYLSSSDASHSDRYYLTVVVRYTAQMMSDIEYLFICLLAIWLFSLEKRHSDPLPSFC